MGSRQLAVRLGSQDEWIALSRGEKSRVDKDRPLPKGEGYWLVSTPTDYPPQPTCRPAHLPTCPPAYCLGWAAKNDHMISVAGMLLRLSIVPGHMWRPPKMV